MKSLRRSPKECTEDVAQLLTEALNAISRTPMYAVEPNPTDTRKAIRLVKSALISLEESLERHIGE